MAIKTISQLDQFDNETPVGTGNPDTGIAIGGRLHWLDDSFLTQEDKDATLAEGWPATSKIDDSNYWDSLFEISQTEHAGANSGTNDTYLSKKIPYQDLIKDIIWDVKSFLNYRHRLSNYNFYNVVDGDQEFHGTKTLIGNMYIDGNLSATNLSATNGNIAHLTSNTISVEELTAVHLSATWLSALNFIGDYVTINKSLSLGPEISAIDTGDREIFFKGWAIGLKYPDTDQKVNCGTWDRTVTPDLDHPTERTGDPVCFRDGVPYELTCVNCATSAYSLINPDRSLVNCGTAGLISTPFAKSKTVVKIVNGVPVECNEIDYAHHAYWSDLGERYLADAEYEPGTLVKFGGEKEITIAVDEVNAIVSTKAFDLNAGLAGGTVIALCGRVPTKVKGKIQKFDKIMLSEISGIACKWDGNSRVIGRALESNDNEDIKLVECVTRFQL